ncbi:MAG: glutamate--tRNA ligase family protein, partial [Candidatus Woesebacteria bacterium]
LLKSNGFPTYHLAAMVDDHLMKISHIIRGRDWLPSTPIHLLLFKFLDIPRPQIGHLTDILDPGGGKLSKRKGTVAVEDFLKQGYLPEAILNFVMLLGWAPKDDREMYSLDEFVENFQKGELQTANPVFNRDKLDWFNGEYIRKMDKGDLSEKLVRRNPELAKVEKKKRFKIVALVQERIKTLGEFGDLAGFFFSAPGVDKSLLGKDYTLHLNKAIKTLKGLKDWELERINDALMKMIEDEKLKTGKFFMDLRIAITGSKVTPPINESMEILGKKEAIARLERIVNRD